jgi:5'-3' exonuclease
MKRKVGFMQTASGFTDVSFHRMVVDMSSLIWTNLLGGEDKEFGRKIEFNGRMVQVNSGQYGYDKAIDFIIKSMEFFKVPPSDVILVVEGMDSKIYRKQLYDGYKSSDKRPPEQYEEFRKCRQLIIDAMLSVGASTITQDNVEGDDIIAYLCGSLEGKITVLTNDGDLALLINDRVQINRMGVVLKENPYGPWPIEFITVYKALVGDTSDTLPGAKGFGDTAFLKLYTSYGDEGLAILRDLMEKGDLSSLEEDAADFAPVNKILEHAETVIKCYKCALLYPERVNSLMKPVVWQVGHVKHHREVQDERLKHLGAA